MRARLTWGVVALVVLLSLLTGCDSAPDSQTSTTPPTAGPTTSSSQAEYVVTLAPTTTTVHTGPCSIVVVITDPEGELIYPGMEGPRLDLMDVDGEKLRWGGSEQLFDGLDPGRYRLAVHAVPTDRYMSQWYGGLPYNGHSASESQILEARLGDNVAEFVLQLGRIISGTVDWSGPELDSGFVFAYPVDQNGDGMTAVLSPDVHGFAIQGLCPGAYKLKFEGNGKEVWFGGDSRDDATVIDVTEGDVTGINIDVGVLPPPPPTVPESVFSDPPPTMSTTTTTGKIGQFFDLDDDDTGRTLSVQVGDTLSVALALHPTPALTACWVEPGPEECLVDYAYAYEDSLFLARCHPLRTGTLRLLVEYADGEGAVRSTWNVDLEVAN